MTNNYGIQMISRIQERRQVEPTHAVIIMCKIIIILVYGMIIYMCCRSQGDKDIHNR